jgi:DNA-binding transcriptional regulator PaaX
MPKNRAFTIIFDDIAKDTRLTIQARLLYVILVSYRRKTANRKSFVFPGQERLAAELGLNTRSVRTYLSELEASGLIVITRRGLTTNLYDLTENIRSDYQGLNREISTPKTEL